MLGTIARNVTIDEFQQDVHKSGWYGFALIRV